MREKIIEFIKKMGPIVPMDLATELRINSIIASAHLSDLLSKKLIKISNLKVGSSPLYYLPEQQKALENFSNYLHEKERIAFNELKEKQVLRDSKLSPLLRVALRNIKDFAVPLEVTFQNQKEIFWKFHSLNNDQASEFIKKALNPVENKKPEQEVKRQQEVKPEAQKQPVLEEKEELKEKRIEKKEPIKESKPIENQNFEQITKPKEKPLEPVKEYQEEPKKEFEEEKEDFKLKNKKEEQKKISKKVDTSDDFLKQVNDFFIELNVNILNYEIIKKDSEIDLEIDVPSNLGNLTYYCKAKNKKRLNETDLDSTYVGGEMKKLPKILLTPGELTKSAKEKLNKSFQNIKFLQIN